MKTSNIRHNLFSKTDHDKVFIEKNYQAAVERNQVVKEELPPIRLDVRKRIAKEQLALRLSRKSTVITHATSMSNDQQGSSNSTRSLIGLVDTCDEDGMIKQSDTAIDDYDDEHASVISNESEELEKLKSSPDINKEEDLLNELGYIGHISEEEGDDDDDDDDDDGSSTMGFSVQGGTAVTMKPKSQYSSTLEVHKEFIGNANRRDTLRQIKSVGSVRALVARERSQRAQSVDILFPSSSSKRNSSIPDSSSIISITAPSPPHDGSSSSSSSKTKHLTSDPSMNSPTDYSSSLKKKTFMFISKLTEGAGGGLPHLMSSIDSAMNRDTSTTTTTAHQEKEEEERSPFHGSPYSNADHSSNSSSKEGYNASPIGIKYKNSGGSRSTFAFTSDSIASAKRDTQLQLVSPLMSASTMTSLMNSITKGGSSPSTIVRGIAPSTAVHLDSITDLGNSSNSSSSSSSSSSSNHHHHKESKYYVPALQSIHNHDKPVMQKLDKIFHRMTFQAADAKPDLVSTPKPPLSLETLFPDQIMKKADGNDDNDDDDDDEMEAYLQKSLASSSSSSANQNRVSTGTAALIDRLDRVLDQHGDLVTMVTRSNKYGTMEASPPSSSSSQSKFKANDNANDKDKDKDNDRHFYKIDVHRLQLPDINAPMICLYTPSPPIARGSSFFSSHGDALQKREHVKEKDGESSSSSSSPPPLLHVPSVTTQASAVAGAAVAPLPSSSTFDSSSPPPLLYSKHSNSFYKTNISGGGGRGGGGSSHVDNTYGAGAATGGGGGGGGGGKTKDKDTTTSHNNNSSLPLPLPLEGILDHSYKQGLSEDTLSYVASMQVAQAIHNDAAFHSLPIVSDLDLMMFSIDTEDDTPPNSSSSSSTSASSSTSIPYYPLHTHTSLPRTHQMKARSVTHEASDSGIYDIDVEEHRKLIPSTVADLSEDGYIYQHSTNSYVRRGVENRSKFGQYQRGEEFTPSSSSPSTQQQQQLLLLQQSPMEFNAPWSEHMDTKGELPVQIFSERHLEEIERSTAGFGSPVIYIPKEPPALEPPLPLHSSSSSSDGSPMKGSIASISSALSSPPSNQHGITQIPGGTALGSSSYAPVRAVMQYPIDSPINYVHYHPTTTTATTATNYGRTAIDNKSGFDTDRSSTYSLVDHSTVRSPTRRKEIHPSSSSSSSSSNTVASLKSDINDYISRLDAVSSSSSALASGSSFRSMSSSIITGLVGVGGEEEVDVVSENDLAKAKLWSRLNSRYSGDRDGEHTAKLKVKQYIYEGIKESTHIENEYAKDMDAWF